MPKTKQRISVLIAAVAMSGVVFALAAPESAYAQGGPPTLVTATGTGTNAAPGAATLTPGTTAEGIKLSESAQSAATAATITAEQAQLQQMAEEAAKAAAATVEAEKKEEEHNRKSYKRASNGLMPLSSDQIRAFMQKLEATQEAAQPPLEGPPKGEVKVAALSLDPGGEPPVINLAAGYVTTIDMVDTTGAPWPILDVGIGGNFEVTPTQAGSHVVRVVPLTRVGSGNLSILLKDLSTPVIFRLSAGGSTFHMRYDARVPKLGPNAKTPIIERGRAGPVAGDQIITMMLENAPPKGAKRLKVAGLDARTMAWQLDDKVFVRTPLTMLSPAWNASASSTDGMTVYEIGDAPVLLMSDSGSMLRARLMRDEENGR